ncbi:hypothetical protein CKO15_12525 [Halorhodospira abdelmalekii]|nr:hypothetical protein [Halorhodospira abdelmalekii]
MQIRNVSRHYEGGVALDRASLSIEPGEVMAILGPSGCGKSTLLRLIAGLDTPTAGEIEIAGETVSRPGRITPPERRPVNMVFQDFALWPHMSVEAIIRFGMKHRGVPKPIWHSRIEELLAMLDLGGMGKRYPRQLSGGQQQRVAIARALATDPQVLLFDEPLSNLDAQLRTQMRIEIAELLQRLETTAIYVTHDIQEAVALGRRLVVMRSGRIEQIGSVREVFQAPASQWIAGLVGYSDSLRGVVEQVQGKVLVIALGDGSSLALHSGDPALTPGTRVALRIRPESIRLLTEDESAHSGERVVNVRVTKCSFEGHKWRVLGDVAGQSITFFSLHPLDAAGVTRVAVDCNGVCAFQEGDPEERDRACLEGAVESAVAMQTA